MLTVSRLRPLFFAAVAAAAANLALSHAAATAQEEDQEDDVFTNYDAMKRDGQAFILTTQTSLYESPDTGPIPVQLLHWFSDFSFDVAVDASDEFPGYVGRGINYFIGDTLEDLVSSGAQIPDLLPSVKNVGLVLEIAGAYVPSQHVFEGRWLSVADDWQCSFWDDGRNRSAFLKGEGHNTYGNGVNAFVARGVMEWISVDIAASVLNVTVEDLTPNKFSQRYEELWNKKHQASSATERDGGMRSFAALAMTLVLAFFSF